MLKASITSESRVKKPGKKADGLCMYLDREFTTGFLEKS